MQRNDSLYLRHIREAIHKIGQYTKGVSRTSFEKNSLIQDAVIRQIEIIGEASKRLSEALRTSNPDIPWEDITGMRNKLVHDYFGVDLEKVWLTVQADIPTLKKQINKILKSL